MIFKIGTSIPKTVLILALFLTSCGRGVLDVQIVPPVQATQTAAPTISGSGTSAFLSSPDENLPNEALAHIQMVALSFLAGSAEDRQSLVKYQITPCSNQPNSGLPACLPGEIEGQALQVFPLGDRQLAYLRLEDIRRRLDFQVKDLHAVYQFPASQAEEYGLLFDRDVDGQPETVLAVVAGDRLVRMEFYPGMTGDAVLNQVPVAQVILPPQQARSWSESLQQMQLHSETEISPDRQWSAQTTIALPAAGGQQYYRRLIVTNKDNSRAYALVDEWSPFGPGYTAPRPLAWFGMSSLDYPVLYWSNVPVIDGCQAFANGSDLHRLDLLSGVSQTLLSNSGSWLAISPDQGRAAVIDGGRLGIYDLSNGQARFTDLPRGQAGQVIWSPDGREVALTIADDDGSGSSCPAAQAATHTILRIETETLEVKLALRQDPRRLNTQGWSQLGLIKLTDSEAKPWLLDPKTGEVWDALAQRPAGTPSALKQIHFFANLYEEDVTALRKLAAQFTAENPGMQIVFTDPPQISHNADNSRDDLLTAVLSENDCLVDWTMPNEFSRRSEMLLELRPLLTLAGAELSQDYWPEQLDGYSMDGKLFGLPMFERPSMMHFNADLLAQKGIPAPSPDWTFDDFISLLTKISDSTAGEKIYGFSADAGSLGQFAEGLFAPVFDTASAPPRANFISPEMAAGLERLAELRRSGAIVYLPATLYAGQDYYDTADAWASGRLAFWQIPYGESTPFPAAEQQPAFRTGVLPLPAHGPFFRNGYSVQQSFYIGKNSSQAEACMAWYGFIVGHPEASNSAPARRSMIENPAWRARVGEANAAALQIAIQRVYTEPPHFTQWATVETPLITQLFSAILDFLGGAEAENVMVTAQSKADAYTRCITPYLGLGDQDLGEAVVTCARQGDPGRY